MKKILLIVLFLSLSCSVGSAQSMTFLNIPMGTSISSFKQKLLAKKGFKSHPLPYENIYGVEGSFAGMQAAFSIETTPKSKLVYSVLVSFSSFNYYTNDYNANQKQKAQENLYEDIRLRLIKKYGQPTRDTFSPNSEFLKWCYWELKNGRVDLMISQPADLGTYRRIQVIYEDSKTAQKRRREEDADW